MKQPPPKGELIQQLIKRMHEVAEHRAARWLEELDKTAGRSFKERLVERIDEVTEALAIKWLGELDQRLCWLRYREQYDDFCYGVGFGECEDCRPEGDHEACSYTEYCKAEFEAEWSERKET